MPSRYVVRDFVAGGIHHVCNRGVEKRTIFLDDQDHQIFLYYLFIYIQPLEKVLVKYPNLPLRLHNKSLNSEVEVFSYCLIPNHFHLLLKQKSANGISKLLKQLTNACTLYFNQKYKRVGGLMQGRFRAAKIEADNLLTHISRYIHLNPLIAQLITELRAYRWSSYLDYIYGHEGICTKTPILKYFPSPRDYEKFVLDQVDYARELENIKHLAFDT